MNVAQMVPTGNAMRTVPDISQIAFADDPLWYKDAIIYQVHVKSFFDSNNDGIGDFPGLIQKLDYIVSLGVNTIWLLPFYPSPRRDDGYDIADYRGVHPDYGTMVDVKRFIAEAHERGLRVITELVINHTSDQHPWFQRARLAKEGSAARDFYVWSDSSEKYAGTRIIFCDSEQSNWTWDPVANAYYWHRFYSHQPDLNFDNPQVLKAVLSVMHFWLKLGVDGLRLDAVPYLVEREGTNNENLPETHEILKRIRAEVDALFPGRMLLAEANQWPEDTQQYFGAGDECHMAFHFPLMPRMYMALAQEDRFPITDILRQTPDIPAHCQWAIFLRNHDELTLEMVTDKERDYLWEKYAVEGRARINLGIRRRLSTLMEHDRRRIELLNSLLLSMPGTPIIYYGDEISMGDNIYLGDRDGVRTPMQWSPDRNGGFSRADPSRLVLPPIMDALYGYEAVNVEAQSSDAHSLLNWMRRMLDIRKRQKAFSRGALKLLYPTNRRVLAYLRTHTDALGATETLLCVVNVGRSAQAVELDLSAYAGSVPVEMMGGSAFPPIGQLPYLLTLPPYGFYWFFLAGQAQMPTWHSPYPEPMPDLITLVLSRGVDDILAEPARGILEREVLPTYLPKRRWFSGKAETLGTVRIATTTILPSAGLPLLLSEIEVAGEHEPQHYLLPLGFISEDDKVGPLPNQLALTRARRGKRVGYLTDAFTLEPFARAIVDLLQKNATLPATDSELRFEGSTRLTEMTVGADAEIRWIGVEQSNSSLVIGDVIIKIIRRIAAGVHPEAEMGRALTERGFANTAQLLGQVTRYEADGTPRTLMVAQQYIHTQGDAWTWSQNLLERALREVLLPGTEPGAADADPMTEFSRFAGVLGRRLGEMHMALAQPTDDVEFTPETVSAADCDGWAASATARLDEAFAVLSSLTEWSSADDRKLAADLLAWRPQAAALIQRLAAQGKNSLRIRIHGDLHLGQVLVSQDDAFFIDFEGEPARPLAERRAKYSPLRDVAGMLRSFDYATAMASVPTTDSTEAGQIARHDLLQQFRTHAAQAFVEAYQQATTNIAQRWSTKAGVALIDLFLLEKAAYEVVYEAANRPEWVSVPLRGLATIVARLGEAHAK
ncbi:MAG: alpha-amylase [Verrucomicrobiaceae bacterium]|nr:alpha-amylase [Verrucomicrobiaceae bacterium]